MYLLLRNNKQSGPYSLEELKSMGLKAYDLVWLEGKSAAWRYPSEIEELKAFAPVVEEQPFDRFYRRPTPAPTATNSAGTTLNAKAPAADAPVPVTVESSKAPGKRIIYVTMPAARNATATTPQSILPRAEVVRESAQPAGMSATREAVQPAGISAAHEAVQPAREFVKPVNGSHEPVPRVIEDYTAHQTQDEAIIEEFFPHKKRSPRVIRLVTVAICILALLAAGIIIGMNLNKETLGLPSRVVAKVPPATPDQAIVHPTAEQLPASAATAPAATTDPARTADTGPTVDEQPKTTPAGQPNATHPATARTTSGATPPSRLTSSGFKTQKERLTHSMARANSLSPAKDSAGSVAANAVHRADVAEPYHDNQAIADKEAIKAALASLVSVGANGYSVGTFGGITDLQLTVTNRSVYPLDLVIVEVQYIQANKKIYKTQELYFHGIGAGSALMQEAPKSSRGVRVQYKIMSITSKEVAYSYSGI